MDYKLLILAITIIIVSTPGYMLMQHKKPNNLIDSQLQNNKAALEIANAYHIPVAQFDLGNDSNGYTVLGQTRFIGNEAYMIILDDSVDPNSYEASAILYHELAHVIYKGGTESQADRYAASRGYHIKDAYDN